MRILLVSDLHYRLPQFDWVVRSAPSFDLVVLAGDHLDISSAVSLDAQSVVILKYLSLLHAAGNVAVSSGNHDLTGPDDHGEQAALWLSEARSAGVPTDGDSLLLGDTLVTICPWWDGPLGRAAVEEQLAIAAARRPARWVWVYHWPPLGSPTCWTGQRHYGDADLVRLDRAAPAGPGAQRPRAPAALQARRRLGRPRRRHLGLQRGAPDRSRPGPYRDRSGCGLGSLVLADGWRRIFDSPDAQAPPRSVF